ncbi:MAG: arylamine N-acetyltransferase [Acetobacteraceae bacterium]
MNIDLSFCRAYGFLMGIDLAAYFSRIAYSPASEEPTLALLRELQIRHISLIPFENIDSFLGSPVDIDPAAIQDKLVHGRRGGYCHEHNSLLHDVLAALGFSVTALAARVLSTVSGAPGPRVLTHRMTLVDLDEGRFVVDVGFGGQSPPAPIRLEPDREQETPFGAYRITRNENTFDLEMKFGTPWRPLYRFNLEPQTHADFEVANWFTSTHPRSRFTQNLIVCRIAGDTRANLLNANLSLRHRDGELEQRSLANADELAQVLSELMGIALPVPAAAIWSKVAIS